MATRTAELIARLVDQVSGPAKGMAGALDGVTKATKGMGAGAPGLDRLTKQLRDAQKQAEALTQLQERMRNFGAARTTFSNARTNVERLSRELQTARARAVELGDPAAFKAVRDLERDHRRAQVSVRAAARALEDEKTAVTQLRRALADVGVPTRTIASAQATLQQRIATTTAAIEKQRRTEARLQRIRGLPGALAAKMGPLDGAVGGALGAYGAVSAYKTAAAFDRRLTMIGQTADATRPEIDALGASVHNLSQATATPVDKLTGGLEALVAQGRNLKESLEFLPSVASTAAATGAEVDDIAKTADSVGSNFKIAGRDMQSAFDIMAAGGKAGQFELKDMARYLPSLGPASAAIGFQGQKGLADLVAMLQVMRKGSGTAEEAVSSMNNVINKMESDKTAKGFKALGVDSEKAFAKARKEGRNLVEVFEELLQQATKGDKSKIGEIIDDQEFKRGALALMSFNGEWQKLSKSLQTTSGGTVAKDIARVTADSQASIDRFNNTYQRVTQAAARGFDMIGGNGRFQGMSGEIEAIATALERLYAAYGKGGLQGVGEAAATIGSEVKDKAQAKLDAIRLSNADDSVRARESAIRQKERELSQAEETVRGGGVRGMLKKGHVFTLQRELEHLRKGLPEIERQRDITKAGPRPLRMGTDPLAPIQGQPGLITPGTKSWQDAYPIQLGTRQVPLPPQRPSSLPTAGAPSGVDDVRELLGTEIKPKVDLSALEQVGPKADQATASLQSINGVTVSPNVSTGELDTLIAKANEAHAALARIPGAVTAANQSIASVRSVAAAPARTGAVAAARSGSFTSQGMG